MKVNEEDIWKTLEQVPTEPNALKTLQKYCDYFELINGVIL